MNPPTQTLSRLPRWRAIGPAVAMIGGGCFVFSPALHGSWIWDDYPYIVQNSALHTVAGLRSIWFAPTGVNYFPVTFTVQWVQWHLWGAATTGYHLTNLALHLLNCFLLWRVLGRLGSGMGWLAGLLFAVHPLAVESVAWISELKNVLSLAFLLGALDAYLDFDERPDLAPYARAWALFVAAILSKSTVVMFPLVLLSYCWWKRGRVRVRDLWASTPFFAVAVGLGLVTVWFEHHRAMVGEAAPESLLNRAAGAGAALVSYAWKSVLPLGLLPSYPHWQSDRPWFWALGPWVVLIAALAGILVSRRPWGRQVAFGLGWFVLNLLPILGFIPMAYLRITNEADHFAYLALPGFLALVAAGCGAPAASERPPFWHWRIPLVAGACLPLAAMARLGARAYESEPAFWQTVLAHNPASWLAHNHLGAAWLRTGRFEVARPEFETALHYAPDYAEAHNNLGVALEDAGELSAALVEFQRARQLRPDEEEARRNVAGVQLRLGTTWLGQNQPAKAVQSFTESLRLDPDSFSAHNNLGIALSRLGRTAEAMSQYEAALRLKPDYPEARTNLGNLFLRLGRPAEAAAQYEAALRTAPDYALARENLDYALRLVQKTAGNQPNQLPPPPP